MSKEAIFMFHEDEARYKFYDDHPFNQQRLLMTTDLLHRVGALTATQLRYPRMATDEELHLVHHATYIQTVKELSKALPKSEWIAQSERFGLSTEDTPYFPGMHEITAYLVGGSLEAAEQVMSGKTDHALHLGGGLHHAFTNKGAGFCVYNDAAVTIANIRRNYSARVLYVDTDVHHGDGVQWSFYTDPDVCTFSIHETGKYLFPGTGAVEERGEAEGYGFNFNLPMEPYTEDASWLECFEEAITRITSAFKPDVIVSQHGCDAHAFDPLSHIHCSMNIYMEMPQILHRLAHQYCEGRWIALGGGGYDIWRVVPRAWSLLWLEMSDHPLLKVIQNDPITKLPEAWIAKWEPQSPDPLPSTWLDLVHDWSAMPRRNEITTNNRHTKQITLQFIP